MVLRMRPWRSRQELAGINPSGHRGATVSMLVLHWRACTPPTVLRVCRYGILTESYIRRNAILIPSVVPGTDNQGNPLLPLSPYLRLTWTIILMTVFLLLKQMEADCFV